VNRIAIVGCSGSGKSTVARALGKSLGLPVIHLDQLWWKAGWIESEFSDFEARVAVACRGQRWIADGNYSRTYHLRFPNADAIVWLDLPRWICLSRTILRTIRGLGRTRADMSSGCPERLSLELLGFIWDFPSKHRPRIEEAIKEQGGSARLIHLRRPGEVSRFLSAMAGEA
jgi:adenylate kinase family enzyme